MVAALDCRLLAALVAVAAPGCQAQGLTGAVGAATDYVYRGYVAGGGANALLGDIQWLDGSGWAFGAGAVGAGDYREVTASASHVWQQTADWTLHAGAAYYLHFGSGGKRVPDYLEAWVGAGWKGRVHASFGVSPDIARRVGADAGQHGPAAVAELTLHQPLGAGFSAEAGVGWWQQQAVHRGYGYGSAGVTWDAQPLLLALTWTASQAPARGLAPPGSGSHRLLAALLLRF